MINKCSHNNSGLIIIEDSPNGKDETLEEINQWYNLQLFILSIKEDSAYNVSKNMVF